MLVQSARLFIAVWFIPTVAVQELTEAISQTDRTFFRTEQVLELSLGQRTLYQTNVAAECMTSSAMGPVSTFTNVSTILLECTYYMAARILLKISLKIYPILYAPSLHFITLYAMTNTVLYLILRMEKNNFNFEKHAFFW